MIRLILASDYQYGQELLQNKNFDDFGGFLSEMYLVLDLSIDLNLDVGIKS
jgi:hypothetical protein